ncbi:hypothetical protein DM01DRAFT_1335425 [Hesseltinella vesiculosa]|uniref:Uncharacterized protein n=1 Tax=Hesseltinella vesiculosa TaxID=101127 RepID=A0A1X2GJK1_9FUNG|nr:hypothetical protein DM01DRAFT_1335425 [Hesseltinella vesiculosa]
MDKRRNSSWRFDQVIQQRPMKEKLVLQEVLSTTVTPAPRHSVISLNPINTISVTTMQPVAARVERYKLQEMETMSPTYSSASVSNRSSLASSFSFSTISSSTSRVLTASPPASPRTAYTDMTSSPLGYGHEMVSQESPRTPQALHQVDNELAVPPASPVAYRSWSSVYHEQTNCEPYAPFMVGSSQPLGWLRRSLTDNAVLDPVFRSGTPSHLVLAGFGDMKAWLSMFGVKPTISKASAMMERTVIWPVDSHQAICTLVTPDMDHPGTLDEFKNLVLCRLGITSIMVCLDITTPLTEIHGKLNDIDNMLQEIDAEHTWYERLILVFHHEPLTTTDLLDKRVNFIHYTLPALMQQLPCMPCVVLFARDQVNHPACRRIVFEQATMHQVDHGWWHGSTSVDSSDSEEDTTSPVVTIIKTSKKRTEFYKYGKEQPVEPALNKLSIDTNVHREVSDDSPSFRYVAPASARTVELEHRFSKRWAESIKRSHTILQDYPLSS